MATTEALGTVTWVGYFLVFLPHSICKIMSAANQAFFFFFFRLTCGQFYVAMQRKVWECALECWCACAPLPMLETLQEVVHEDSSVILRELGVLYSQTSGLPGYSAQKTRTK